MPNVTLIGDIHGTINKKDLMVPNSIQLGDLDLFGYDQWSFDQPRYFIDGNHDNFPLLNTNSDNLQEINNNLFYIPRGYINGKVLFIGGAFSIDHRIRTIGFDLHLEECLTKLQFDKIINKQYEIEVVIAHDFPFFVYKKRLSLLMGNMSHAQGLEIIFSKFRPKLWINGHHHVYQEDVIEGCKFITVPMEKSMMFDLPLGDFQ